MLHAGKRYPKTTFPRSRPLDRDRRTHARDRMPTPESLPTHRGRRFRPGADRFRTATLPPSPPDETLPTHAPLTTPVEIPMLRSSSINCGLSPLVPAASVARAGLR